MYATATKVRKTFKSSDEDYEERESARSDRVVCSDVLGLIKTLQYLNCVHRDIHHDK